MKLIINSLLLLFFTGILCAQSDINSSDYKQIVQKTDEIYERLVTIRRDIHMHPELSKEEHRTSKIVADYLKNLGLEVKTDIGGKGVVGILKGSKEGRKIAWRADMDAIATNDPDVVSFSSKNEGVRHICGHDVHTTIALGMATVLSEQKEELSGTIYFIFQPAEELFSGARDMIADGLFDLIDPDEIYGLHIGPEQAGMINFKENELFAHLRSLTTTFKPDVDEEALTSFMTGIYNNLSRDNGLDGNPWETLSKVTDPEIGLLNKETIFKDFLLMQGSGFIKYPETAVFNATFLETSRDTIEALPAQIEQQILNSPFKDSFISIAYTREDPTPMNDPELTKTAMKTILSFYNNNLCKPMYGQIPYFNEDFIFYQEKVPGVFFILGGSNLEDGIIAMPHTPNFAVDEKTIKYGVQSFASLLLKRTQD